MIVLPTLPFVVVFAHRQGGLCAVVGLSWSDMISHLPSFSLSIGHWTVQNFETNTARRQENSTGKQEEWRRSARWESMQPCFCYMIIMWLNFNNAAFRPSDTFQQFRFYFSTAVNVAQSLSLEHNSGILYIRYINVLALRLGSKWAHLKSHGNRYSRRSVMSI